MSTITCFWLEPTGTERRWLRRFTFSADGGGRTGKPCPTGYMGGHDATVYLDDAPGSSASGDSWSHDDPRWPKACEACGYAFEDGDEWQLFTWQLYRRSDTDELVTLQPRPQFDSAPAGAMWNATWYAPEHDRGDGIHLLVRTPGGDWDVDGPASNGPGWERTGVPPNVTATPSIGKQNNDGSWRYHGWLRNGELVDA